MIEFIDDDLSYLAWVAAHPDGYVLNVRRSPDRRYVVLHRASCLSISNETHAPSAYTERGYRKLCASSVTELQAAAKRKGRSDGTFRSDAATVCRWVSQDNDAFVVIHTIMAFDMKMVAGARNLRELALSCPI